MTYDDFPISAAVAWVADVAPDLTHDLRPAPPDRVDAFEALFETDPPDQVLEFLETMGGGSALPFARSWRVDVEVMLAAYAARPWLADPDVASMLIPMGYKLDARQYELFLRGPFVGGRAGSLAALDALPEQAARDGEVRPAWIVAGSLAEFICLPVFVERVVSAGPEAPTRWIARAGEAALLDPARAALEDRGFEAEPFSTDDAAALRRDAAAVALIEHSYPLEAIACGSPADLREIAAALAEAGGFDRA